MDSTIFLPLLKQDTRRPLIISHNWLFAKKDNTQRFEGRAK